MKSRTQRLLTALAVFLGLALLPSVALAAHAGAATRADAAARPSQPDAAPTAAQETVAAMQPGWNLGNSFDSTGDDETSWGNPKVTRELLSSVRAEGFNSIRIPVTWGQHQGAAPDYTIDQAYVDRVQEVVGWALDEGFYVLINMHHDSWQWVSGMPTQHDEVLARYTAAWTQIADAFRDASPKLLFESINEPTFDNSSGDAQNAELLNELNTTFHTLVRDSGGENATRLLVLPTLHSSPEQARVDEMVEAFTAFDDPNLVATVHYYGFWPFSVNIAGYTTFNEEVRQDLTDTFDRVNDAFVAQGIPVIVGEYGLLGFDRSTDAIEQGEKLKFFEFLGEYARERQLTTMLWDNGQHFGRTSFEWSDPALFRQISSSWTTASATASTDQVFVPAGQDPADAAIALDLAGNTLDSVTDGSQELVEGEDYTLSGEQLTLAAATLARLTEGKDDGVAAVLTLRFSAGAPWDVNVIVHEAPVFQDAGGTTTSLVIPTAFHGDRLATMEAVYADGTPAGPQNWTPYKEFGATFLPDYAAGETTLTSDFFAEVADGSTVTLTFHFWSGATASYTLTRSGTTVTGTAG